MAYARKRCVSSVGADYFCHQSMERTTLHFKGVSTFSMGNTLVKYHYTRMRYEPLPMQTFYACVCVCMCFYAGTFHTHRKIHFCLLYLWSKIREIRLMLLSDGASMSLPYSVPDLALLPATPLLQYRSPLRRMQSLLTCKGPHLSFSTVPKLHFSKEPTSILCNPISTLFLIKLQ